MAVINWDDDQVVYVGATLPTLRAVFQKEDGRTVRDLTGYFGWFTFACEGQPIHIVRAGFVTSTPQWSLVYRLRGDEYIADPGGGDTHEILVQASISHTDYDSNAKGRGFFVISHPMLRRIVVKRPT